jgi:triphosphoribosyl-dephospho-CoA synthase
MMTPVAINLLLKSDVTDNLIAYQHRFSTSVFFAIVAELAYHAMLVEVHLTPKPGLVDLRTHGAHPDMNVALFETSAAAIRPYLIQFLQAGFEYKTNTADGLLTVLRPIGLYAERAMFAATNSVNTHKGMIFGLGLICGSVGWLWGRRLTINATYISQTIRQSCSCLVMNELENSPKPPKTHGEQLFQEYGLTGARGEAASGYNTILRYSLSAYNRAIDDGYAIEQALWQSLLVLMVHNDDTNIVSRGGMHGLRFVKTAAESLLEQGGCANPNLEQQLIDLDRVFSRRRLSPGGSADLLAMTWLLSQINELM